MWIDKYRAMIVSVCLGTNLKGVTYALPPVRIQYREVYCTEPKISKTLSQVGLPRIAPKISNGDL